MSITDGQLLGLALRHKEDLLKEDAQMIRDMADEICELRERVEQLEKPVKVADDDGGEELERVIRTLKKEYARAKTIAYVTNPMHGRCITHGGARITGTTDGGRRRMIDTYIKRSDAIIALEDTARKLRQNGNHMEGLIYNLAALTIERLPEYQGELPEKGDNDVQKYKVIINAVNTMLMAGTNKRSKGHVWDALTYDTAAKRLREMKTYEVVLPEDNEDDEDFWDEEEFEDEAD